MSCVRFKLTSCFAMEPTKATAQAVGWDLYAHAGTIIAPGEARKIFVGVALEMPPGIYCRIYGRSGLNSRGIVGMTGIIDPDYRGELACILLNTTAEDFRVYPGDRVGQLVFARNEEITWELTGELSTTSRGESGFGSTGN
jgi:dUTP pyrophosphatase